jgi:hypothetical protein
MTACALCCRAFENIVDMTIIAGHFCMSTIQLESRQVMVKCGGLPGIGGMTRTAILPEGAFMFVVFLVAVNTSARRTFENLVGMAVVTFGLSVFAG